MKYNYNYILEVKDLLYKFFIFQFLLMIIFKWIEHFNILDFFYIYI